MKPGPKKKPTALKLLAGNPGKRSLNTREPVPDKASLRCPKELKGDARTCWKRIVPQLSMMGVLGKIDADALVMYCITWAQYKEALAFLAKNGLAYPILDSNGQPKCIQQFPQVAIARNNATLLLQLQREFGMTTSSRSGITVAPTSAADVDNKARFFKI